MRDGSSPVTSASAGRWRWYRAAGAATGTVLTAAGLLGLYNLAGAGGDELYLLQTFPLVAVVAGLALAYGATQPPGTYLKVASYVLAGGAVVVLATSAISAYAGTTGTGPLARFFLGLGVVVAAIGLGGGFAAWKLRHVDPGTAENR